IHRGSMLFSRKRGQGNHCDPISEMNSQPDLLRFDLGNGLAIWSSEMPLQNCRSFDKDVGYFGRCARFASKMRVIAKGMRIAVLRLVERPVFAAKTARFETEISRKRTML